MDRDTMARSGADPDCQGRDHAGLRVGIVPAMNGAMLTDDEIDTLPPAERYHARHARAAHVAVRVYRAAIIAYQGPVQRQIQAEIAGAL